jgi:hypothetical protein
MSRFWAAGASSSSEDEKGSDSDSYDQPIKQASGAKFGMMYDSDSGKSVRAIRFHGNKCAHFIVVV